MPKIVGIDLGTSTTCAAVVQDGQPSVIPGVRGSRVTPSYIYVMEGGRILVGENAKAEVIADPYNTIWATKRLIGRKFDDPSVQEARERLPYKISSSQKNEILIHGRDKVFTPVSVASLILKFAIRLASKQMNEPVSEAVITVPASFNDLQRKATKLAGERVGLKIERLVNEPTASALAWGYQDDSERTVAIYDLGGGTFDVSIMAIGRGVYEVLATRGDSWLGGEDFDNRLVDYVVESFKRHHQINIYNDKMAHQRVKTAAEQAKIELSVKDSARIYLPSICPDVSKWADVDYTITRDQFESLVEDMVDHTIQTFKGALEDVELGLDELDNVILVGGVTRMPLVRAKLKEFLGREPDHSIDPDEAVGLGAAIHAAALAGEKIAIKPAPEVKAKKRRKKETDKAAALPEPGDEAVALEGAPDEPATETDRPAAAPASKRAPLLIDVLSQAVGIADVAGLFVPLLKRNTKLPARVSQVFTTAMDRQQAIRISVHQGEEKRVKDKVVLGEFVLEGIERAPRGVPQIEVTFNIDHSGIFTVSAKDLKTNVAREIKVEGIQL